MVRPNRDRAIASETSPKQNRIRVYWQALDDFSFPVPNF